MRSPFLILIPLLLLALPAVAAGQVIRGQVVDEDRNPVSSATVFLLSETEEVLRTVEADDEGDFRLEGISAGFYLLRVERLGYETTTTPPLLVDEGSTVVVELRVAVDAIPLEPLVIRQRARTHRLDPLIQAGDRGTPAEPDHPASAPYPGDQCEHGRRFKGGRAIPTCGSGEWRLCTSHLARWSSRPRGWRAPGREWRIWSETPSWYRRSHPGRGGVA